MARAAGWLVIAILALAAHGFDSDALRIACAAAVFGLLIVSAPRALRSSFVGLALLALAVLSIGGIARLLDALPALIAGSVAWLFARSLRAGRRPLIARAIAALDGEQELADPATARYARRLTEVWAGYQALLALIATLLAVHVLIGVAQLPRWLPGPRAFGAIVLPLAVAGLLLGEFALRRWLLPRAPRHRLHVFVRELVRAWPKLLDEG